MSEPRTPTCPLAACPHAISLCTELTGVDGCVCVACVCASGFSSGQVHSRRCHELSGRLIIHRQARPTRAQRRGARWQGGHANGGSPFQLWQSESGRTVVGAGAQLRGAPSGRAQRLGGEHEGATDSRPRATLTAQSVVAVATEVEVAAVQLPVAPCADLATWDIDCGGMRYLTV